MHFQLRKHLVTCALLAGVGLGAQAQTAPTAATPAAEAGQRHGKSDDPARHAQRMQERLAELKQKLQLSPGQEAAWTSFTTALQPQPRQRPDTAALAALSTPERLDRMRLLREQRTAEMDRRAEATKAFYAVLTPAQKKTFDDETLRLLQRPRMHGGHHGMHRGAAG